MPTARPARLSAQRSHRNTVRGQAFAAGCRCGGRRPPPASSLQPGRRLAWPMPHVGRRGGVLFVPPSRARLGFCARGHVNRLLDDRSGRQPAGRSAWRQGRGPISDAPLEPGGTEGAKSRQPVRLLVGGTMAILERPRPAAGGGSASRNLPTSARGLRQKARRFNQVLVAAAMRRGRAMALGQPAGAAMRRVCQALASGAAGSWALENRAGGMLEGGRSAGFSSWRCNRKDLAIALARPSRHRAGVAESANGWRRSKRPDEACHGDEDVSAR